MANAVLRSAGDLLAVDVLELELDLQHVDVPRYLVNKRLKLKFRMNGVTYLKSKARKAVTDGDHCRVNLDIAGGVVFEGGTSLDFELCRVRFWGPSKTLASCKVPLDLALQSINVGSNQARVWNLTLWAAGAPDKALGSLMAEVCARTLKAHVAVSIAALRSLAVPRRPRVLGNDSAARLIAIEWACRTFASRAAEARQRLREALDAALEDDALLGGGPKGAPPRSARESPGAAH
uniref:Uncharacterized protein n=1 Tax=Pyrodinium bahamense TaxID=73915 RepID=A0A7S0BB63_9DINO